LSVLNYNEIQNPRKRKGIIDFDRLMDLLGFENYDDLKDAHYKWVDSAMQTDNSDKENNRKHIFMESTTTIFDWTVFA